MSVASWLQTVWATMTSTAYKNVIDANFAVAQRMVDNFAPREQAAPNMTILLDAGHTYDGTTLTEVVAQSTATIATPATGYMRIDRIVIDSAGVNSVITGTPVTSAPVAPAITSGAFPVCQVLLDATSAPVTAIVNSMITDERALAVGYAVNAANAHYAIAGKNVGIAADTNLETWADSLPRCGMYDIYLSVAQGNLPTSWWHIELQRHSGDAAGNLYHIITAKILGAGSGLMYTNTCYGGTWSGWIQVVTSIGGLISANGGQIQFPATQNPSANANTLDDYEEGTWTPNVGGTATYGFQSGEYIKIGRFVSLHCDMTINAIGSGSQYIISGSPFAGGGGAGAVSFTSALVTSIVSISADYANAIYLFSRTAASTSNSYVNVLGNSSRVICNMCFLATN